MANKVIVNNHRNIIFCYETSNVFGRIVICPFSSKGMDVTSDAYLAVYPRFLKGARLLSEDEFAKKAPWVERADLDDPSILRDEIKYGEKVDKFHPLAVIGHLCAWWVEWDKRSHTATGGGYHKFIA